MLWELCEFSHQLEPFGSNGHQLLDLGLIVLLSRESKIGQGYRVEIVIRKSDKPESDAAEFYDFIHNPLKLSLSRLLAIRSPHATKGTML